MKKFIIEQGRSLIDLGAWIVLILIILIGVIFLFSNPLVGIGVLIIGLVLFVISNYLLYLFIDIRDLLKEIVEKQNNTDKE